MLVLALSWLEFGLKKGENAESSEWGLEAGAGWVREEVPVELSPVPLVCASLGCFEGMQKGPLYFSKVQITGKWKV